MRNPFLTAISTSLLTFFSLFADLPLVNEEELPCDTVGAKEEEEDIAQRDNMKDTLYDSNEREIRRREREARFRQNQRYQDNGSDSYEGSHGVQYNSDNR